MTIKEALSKFLSKIKAKMNVKCVILFGSRARGDFMPHSDVDLIIIGDFTEKFLDRILIISEENDSPYNFETFCYTELEFESMFKRGNALVLDAIYEGIPLEGEEFFRMYKNQMNSLIKKGLKRTTCTWVLVS